MMKSYSKCMHTYLNFLTLIRFYSLSFLVYKMYAYQKIKDDTETLFKERQKEIAGIRKLEDKLHKQPEGETTACMKTYQKLIKQRQKRLKEMLFQTRQGDTCYVRIHLIKFEESFKLKERKVLKLF